VRVFKYIGCNFGLVLKLLQILPGIAVLSRIDNLASLHGFEAIVLILLGLLGDLFWMECEPSNHFGNPITAMNWPPVPFLFQGLLLVLQPKSAWVVICVEDDFV
jgi:hypothetical protein